MKKLESRVPVALAIVMTLIAAVLVLSPLPLNAQAFYGSVVGTVTDASGAVVPNATVKVTNIGTSISVTVESETSGRYSVVNLVPGPYNVEVSKSGFKRFVREKLVVEVGQVTRADAPLQVGTVNEAVEVTTNAPLLQTDSSTLGQEIEGALVQEIPLNGRNVMNLMALAPGVVPTGGAMGDTGLDQGTRTGGGAGWGNYEIGGAIQGQSGAYIDGVANNLLGGNLLALVPTQDAVQEFNVASSNAGADFGRYSGGVVNMTTRTGTNAWHGSVWEYNRNRDYNANDFFSNLNGTPRGVWNQNQFGASVSGPIKSDKAFFMFTWEAFHALTGSLSDTYVPTLALQNGVFSQTLPADPLGICDIEPYTGQTVSGLTFPSGGSYIKNLYVPNGGLMPGTTCGDPSTEVMKQFYPLPNANLPNANFFLDTPLGNNQEQYNGRVDYTLSQKQRLFARYTYWAPVDQPHTEFDDIGYKNGTSGNGTTWPTDDGKSSYFTTQGVLGDTITLSQSTVLDVRLNYVRQYSPNFAQGLNVNEAQFGPNFAAIAPTMNVHLQPAFNASGSHGFYNMSSYPNDGITWNNTYGANASLNKILGAHSLKLGGEIRLMDESAVSHNGGGSGSFTFGNSAWLNDEWANFLVGYSSSGSFKTALETAAYMYYQGYYLTDSWQAARNLTINAGIRYELPGGVAERNNRVAVLLPNTVDPITGITGTEAMVASSLYSGRSTLIPEHNLFAPDIGFAYRASAITVVRAGYGISYLPNDISGGWNPNGAYVNSATSSWNHATNNPVPVQMQSDLAAIAATGIAKSPGRYANASTQPTLFMSGGVPGLPALVSLTNYQNKNISGGVPNQPYPFTQHWNAALSHEFKGNMMIEVSYSGLKGLNMPESGSHQLNAVPDALMLSIGSGLAATATSCAAAPGLVGSTANKFTVGQCDRPYPYYNSVSDTLGYLAIENYYAFSARMEKRMGAGGVLSANYTNSRNKGDTDTQNGFIEQASKTQGGSGNAGIMDWNNLKGGEYSLISYDVTNRFVVSYVLSLPLGRGQKFGNSFGDAVNTAVSGWTLNGITTFQSGFPTFFSVNTAYQLGNYGAGGDRPLVVPGCQKKIGGSGLAREQTGAWFNLSCFENVGTTTNLVTNSSGTVLDSMTNPYLPAGWSTGYLYGNEPRVDPTLRGDGIKNFDVAVGKSTTIHEKAKLEFRAEFFNIMNRVQFSPPLATVGAQGYGTVAYQANHPRQIQLSMRLNY